MKKILFYVVLAICICTAYFLGTCSKKPAIASSDTELVELNLSGISKELSAGTTIYFIYDPTTLVVSADNTIMTYITPRNTRNAGYNFNVAISSVVIYAPFHAKLRAN